MESNRRSYDLRLNELRTLINDKNTELSFDLKAIEQKQELEKLARPACEVPNKSSQQEEKPLSESNDTKSSNELVKIEIHNK